MKELYAYINKIYILRDLKRYNNSLRIKEESVAEHLTFVSLIVLKLTEYYKFDIKVALIMALTHDISEIYVTDIPHNVKKRFNTVSKQIKLAEKEVFVSEFPNYYSFYEELEYGKTIESKIVELADVLSCLQYSNSEIVLGNKGYMVEVYKYSKKRINKLLKELKKYARK